MMPARVKKALKKSLSRNSISYRGNGITLIRGDMCAVPSFKYTQSITVYFPDATFIENLKTN